MPVAVALPRNAAASMEASLTVRARTPFSGVVLGIDPSLRGTGLALVEFAAGRQPPLASSGKREAAATKSKAGSRAGA